MARCSVPFGCVLVALCLGALGAAEAWSTGDLIKLLWRTQPTDGEQLVADEDLPPPVPPLPFGQGSTIKLVSPELPDLVCDVKDGGAKGEEVMDVVSLRGLGSLDDDVWLEKKKKKKKKYDKEPILCDHIVSPFPWDAYSTGFMVLAPGKAKVLPPGSIIMLNAMATKKACAPVEIGGLIVCNASSLDPGAAFKVFLPPPPPVLEEGAEIVAPPQSAPRKGLWLALHRTRTWLRQAAIRAGLLPPPLEDANDVTIEINLLHYASNMYCAPASELHEPLKCDVNATALGDAAPPTMLLKITKLWPPAAADVLP